MKNLTLVFSLFLSLQSIYAQSTVEAFISKASDIQLNQCNVTRQEVAKFHESISSLKGEIDEKSEKLNDEAQADADQNEDIAKRNAEKKLTQEYGISDENMAKLKNKEKLSESDKEALINDALKKQGNMNLAEAQKLSQMSEKDKQKYAEQYTANQMQKQKTNPTNQTSKNNSEKLSSLINKQKTLTDKIQADNHRIEKLYADFKNDTIERNKMYENIQNWQTKWYELSGIDYGQGPKMEALAQKIREEQIKICDNNTPRYQDILTKHLSMIKSSYLDYIELHKVTNQLSNAAIGIQSSEVDNPIFGLKLVNEYLSKLSAAYYYKLYFPEDEH